MRRTLPSSATAAYSYAPYGKTTSYGTGAAANRFRWLGRPQDTTANSGDGHYKLGARYYNTAGHFTQPDPIAGGIGDPRTMTAYNYAGGDPINQADASGIFFTSLATKLAEGKLVYDGVQVLQGGVSKTELKNFVIAEGSGLLAEGACVEGVSLLGPVGVAGAVGCGVVGGVTDDRWRSDE